tara:strand:- start:4126 stop:4569 length:444 start_codon:yes stop_codon:yes gene_type:complete
MKVILLDTISHIGKKYEVKEIKDGFVRNFLLPQKKVMLATKKNLETLESKKSKEAEIHKMEESLLIKGLEDLKGKKITVNKKTNEEGHLYDSIDKAELIKEISTQVNINLNEKNITLDRPIKEVGEHIIPISIGDHKGSVCINVEKI